jgi:hypothetical protein
LAGIKMRGVQLGIVAADGPGHAPRATRRLCLPCPGRLAAALARIAAHLPTGQRLRATPTTPASSRENRARGVYEACRPYAAA